MAAAHGGGPNERKRLTWPSLPHPEYLGGDYANASPALRFGMFLPIWTKQWRKDDDGGEGFLAKGRQTQSIRQ